MSEPGFTVGRIVPDLVTERLSELADFYADIFGLDTNMDQGWVRSLGPCGGGGELIIMAAAEVEDPVPMMSIGVDDVDAAYARARAADATIVYEITDEPWGVRRFFLADPDGRVVNVVGHHPSSEADNVEAVAHR